MINSHNDMCRLIVGLEFCSRHCFNTKQTCLYWTQAVRAPVSPDCVFQNQERQHRSTVGPFIKRNFPTQLLLKVLVASAARGSTIVSDEGGNRSARAPIFFKYLRRRHFFPLADQDDYSPDSFVLPNCSLMHKPLFLLKEFKDCTEEWAKTKSQC